MPEPAVSESQRDQNIDTWRAAALLRVVVYHTLGWVWLTILFPAVGLMFALAGSLTARSLDRRRPGAPQISWMAQGTRVVRNRLRRLLPPLWIFGGCAIAVIVHLGWRSRPDSPLGWGELLLWILPIRTPPAGGPEWSWAFTCMLWYLVTYLWFVVFSPITLRLFRRWPWQLLAVSLLVPVLLHYQILSAHGYLLEPLTNVATYASCWLLGYAYHDRLLWRIPGNRFVLLVGSLGLVSAIWLLLVGSQTNDFDINHIFPAKGLWSATFVAVVLRINLPIGALGRVRWLTRVVDFVNARAVTIYLWHFAMLIAAGYLLDHPVRPLGVVKSVELLGTVLVLTALATLLTGWVEDLAARRQPSLIPPARKHSPVRISARGPAQTPPQRPRAPRLPVRDRGGLLTASVVALLALGLTTVSFTWKAQPQTARTDPHPVAQQAVDV